MKNATNLPVRVVLVLTAWLRADVGLLGGKLGGDPLLEVDPGQVILQVSVGVPSCGLEMTYGAGWDTLLIPVYSWFSNDQIIALSFLSTVCCIKFPGLNIFIFFLSFNLVCVSLI